jgi:hypothetical protein
LGYSAELRRMAMTQRIRNISSRGMMTIKMAANCNCWLALISAIMLSSCNITGDCRNQLKYRSPSPNGAYDIVVFNRNCGATSGNNVQISIIEHSEPMTENEHGNILSAYGVGYTESIKPLWLSQNAINIYMYRDARIGFRKNAINGISINYIFKDIPASH